MRFDIISTFPGMLKTFVTESIIGKAIEAGSLEIHLHDLRKWTSDKRRTVDDRPFGGGPGMLLMLEPLYLALKELGVYPIRPERTNVLLTSAGGQTWSQRAAVEYAQNFDRVVLICGRYEGVDARVEKMIDNKVSIGGYVLTGGELPAAVIIDSVARLIPGVLGNEESLAEESFGTEGEVEYPQFTRPAQFITDEGERWDVPDVLLSGNHAEISLWRQSHMG